MHLPVTIDKHTIVTMRAFELGTVKDAASSIRLSMVSVRESYLHSIWMSVKNKQKNGNVNHSCEQTYKDSFVCEHTSCAG